MRKFGIKHNRYAFCRVALAGKIANRLPLQSCSEGYGFLIPNSPMNPSVVRIFIAPQMRFLNPDEALLH